MSLEILKDPGAHCSMIRQFEWHIVWRPEQYIYPGMQMELRVHKLRSFHTWTFVRSEIDKGDISFRCRIKPSVSERRLNPNRVVFRARFQYGLEPGEPVVIRLTGIPGIWLGIEPVLSAWVTDIPNNFAPDAELPPPQKDEGSECILRAGPGTVERLSVYSRPMPGPDGTVRTLLVPEDRFGNPARFARPVRAALEWNGETRTVEIESTADIALPAPAASVGRAVASIQLADLSRGETIENGVPVGTGRAVTGNPVWRDPVDDRRPVFGEFHWHTDFSGDGQRSIREALRCARDELNLDYVAPGDHNPRGENWVQTVEALQEANEPDRFSTFFGWECGGDRGHENFYFTQPDHPLRCGGEAGIHGGRPADLADAQKRLWAERQDFIVIPHHTNAVAETRKLEDDSPFWHPYPWTEPVPFKRQVEIMQTRGNQERNDYTDAWRGWHQNNQSSAQDALRKGFRLGFVGGTDNHCGWPGRAYAKCESPGVHSAKSVILTGLWTSANQRDDVFAALCERRSWAVWDTRALVDFRVNGLPAGGQLTLAAGEDLTATLRLSAEDALRTIEIVSEGEVVWGDTAAEPDIERTVPLGTVSRPTHFYLRALEHKGGIIYASPVFVEPART